MSRDSIHLETVWEIQARRREIAEVLSHAETFADWWGGVFLSSELVAPGDADGVGRIVKVRSKGLVPYDLAWTCCVIRSDLPECWVAETQGDLNGKSTWTLTRGPSGTTVHFDWTVAVRDAPFAAMISFARPLMAFNHRWAMNCGMTGLISELQRRRITTHSPDAVEPVHGRCLESTLH